MGAITQLKALYNNGPMVASMATSNLPVGQLVVGSTAPSTAATTFTLSAPVPAWVVANMPVYDVTSGALLGKVASAASSTVTMAANSLANGTAGDVVQFGYTPSDLAVSTAAGSDIRGLTDLAMLKCREASKLLTDLEAIITSGQDATANTQLAAAVTSLA